MGIRKLIGRTLRRVSAAMLPIIAYFTLAFGRRKARLTADDASVIEIRDRKSDITVVSFAGLAALHGGMVNYEFTNLLRKHGLTPNLVFVRDPLCACYHIAPDGTPTGLAYYEARVREAVEKLGARHNVAIGTSIGGMAAVAFGHRVGFDQVIAFSPSWPPERYMLDNSLAGLVARAKLLIRRPGAWIERLLLGHMARISAERLRDAVGADVLDLEAELATSTSLPDLTVYHGEGCEPDVLTAKALCEAADAHVITLPTLMHNSTGYLARRGELVGSVFDRIEVSMHARGLVPHDTIPPSYDTAPLSMDAYGATA